MLQLGRYSYRGKGAVLVTGPCGAALVPLAWTGSAEEAMTGRVQVGVWARDIASARADAFILDLAGPQVIVSLIGSARIKAGRLGHAEPEEWSPPVWGKPIDPGEWEYLDVTLGDTQDGAWRLLDDDAVLAGYDPDDDSGEHLTLGELQRTARNVLRLALSTPAMTGPTAGPATDR